MIRTEVEGFIIEAHDTIDILEQRMPLYPYVDGVERSKQEVDEFSRFQRRAYSHSRALKESGINPNSSLGRQLLAERIRADIEDYQNLL